MHTGLDHLDRGRNVFHSVDSIMAPFGLSLFALPVHVVELPVTNRLWSYDCSSTINHGQGCVV
jgi:hypothetical protein